MYTILHTSRSFWNLFAIPTEQWFLENVQFGPFSGAALSLGGSNHAKVTMYQCSTESNTGCGYFCIDAAGSGSGTYSGNQLLDSYFGSPAHPGTNRTHAWTVPTIAGQQRDEFPSLKIRLRGNVGTANNGQPIPLPDIDYMPTSLFAVGPMTNSTAPGISRGTKNYNDIVSSRL